MAQIGPAVTTLSYENPGYGLITIDKKTMLPVNYQIWAMDLDEANLTDSPEWKLNTDYMVDYGLNDMSPDSMYALAERMRNDRSFAGLYNWHKSRKVGVPKEVSAAGAASMACDLQTSEVMEGMTCKGSMDRKEQFRNWIIGDWVTKGDTPILAASDAEEYLQ